jgi:4-carboxymuconolactone decarboxylase
MPDDASLFDKGLEMQWAVLGAEYVNRSIANVDEFNKPFQKLITEWHWSEVSTQARRKTRSMLNLAMLTR